VLTVSNSQVRKLKAAILLEGQIDSLCESERHRSGRLIAGLSTRDTLSQESCGAQEHWQQNPA
jgi:hypothetical protein